MKTSDVPGKKFLQVPQIYKKRIGLLTLFIFSLFHFSELKSQGCSDCCVPSFPSLTLYTALQTGHGVGFGVEAGKWNKDASRFSLFGGMSLVWAQNTDSTAKTTSTKQNQTFMTFYVKGQYRLSNHLYVVAAPGIVNLTYLELQTGIRYVVPITRVIGIGIEPAYALSQKQFTLNMNMHFALR